mmetsp:Transcript_62914/g.149030  ORF Transcript_62914/g.149030 Transcript_62914/m.149030 type:complete len:308 (-) Transcript_62914:589-1512(-)
MFALHSVRTLFFEGDVGVEVVGVEVVVHVARLHESVLCRRALVVVDNTILVKLRHKQKQQRHNEHCPCKHEELKPLVPQLGLGHNHHNDVPDCHCHQPHRGHHRLHAHWRLGIRELKARDGHHDFPAGEKSVLRNLGEHVGLCVGLVDVDLEESRGDEGERRKDHAAEHAGERLDLYVTVNHTLEEGNQTENEERIEHLHVVGLDVVAQAGIGVHLFGLERPSSALLIKESPEERHRDEHEEDPENALDVLDKGRGMCLLGPVQEVRANVPLVPVGPPRKEYVHELDHNAPRRWNIFVSGRADEEQP